MDSGAISVNKPASTESAQRCASCQHFNHAAHSLEREIPGLAALSSAHAAVRSDDGLCRVHDRYVASYYTCSRYQAACGE